MPTFIKLMTDVGCRGEEDLLTRLGLELGLRLGLELGLRLEFKVQPLSLRVNSGSGIGSLRVRVRVRVRSEAIVGVGGETVFKLERW